MDNSHNNKTENNKWKIKYVYSVNSVEGEHTKEMLNSLGQPPILFRKVLQ